MESLIQSYRNEIQKIQTFLMYSIFYLLFTSPALASIGPDVKKYDEKEWNAICKLTITDSSGKTGICTATFIDESHILTAEHCFTDAHINNMIVVASCGDQEIDEFESLRKYRNDKNDKNGFDLAILKTKNPHLFFKPIQITKYPEMYFSNPKCKVLGYGIDEYEKSDHLRGFDLTDVRLDFNQQVPQPIKMSPKIGPSLKNTVTEGDSGGPLLCQIHPRSPWEILGVSQNYKTLNGSKEVIANTFAPAFVTLF